MKYYNTGLVLGKFCPLHKGHLFLLSRATQQSRKLYVVVDNIMDDVIPVRQRMDWIREEFPGAIVLTQGRQLPQYPTETPLFWDIWREELNLILPEKIDSVFASENYGLRLAEELGAVFHPVDISRSTFPISASRIRNNLLANWNWLADSAKRSLGVSICIFGPESTGKSTMTHQLSMKLGVPYVDEYAVEVIKRKNRDLAISDMIDIVVGHNRSIRRARQSLPPLLIVDTDALTSKIWSEELFGQTPPEIEYYIKNQNFDLYLLLDIDLPWVDDIHRYRPNERSLFFDKCRRTLEEYGRDFVVVMGKGSERLQNAVEAIKSRFPYLGCYEEKE